MAKPNAKAPLGQGGRFVALKDKIASEKGISGAEAGAIAANAGREKYGAKKFSAMAAKGKK